MKAMWAMLLAAAVSLGGTTSAAAAEADPAVASYPNHPIKLVVGYVAGGVPDGLARVLAETLGKRLGQPVVVDNRPGAGGTISAAITANAAPDGYTLTLAGTGQTGIAPYLFRSPGYDPLKSFVPIGMVANTPMYIVCNPKLHPELCTVDALVRKAKEQPGRVTYGSSGLGSGHHIAMEVFQSELGIKLSHVPYKGSGQSITSILSGEVDLSITSWPAIAGHLQNGTIRIVAITTRNRSPLAPDAEPVAKWIPGYDYPAENGLLAPAGTPRPIVDKLARALKESLASPELAERFRALDSEIDTTSGEAYRARLVENLKKYQRATSLAGLKPN